MIGSGDHYRHAAATAPFVREHFASIGKQFPDRSLVEIIAIYQHQVDALFLDHHCKSNSFRFGTPGGSLVANSSAYVKPLPDFVAPKLLTVTTSPPQGKQSVHELKMMAIEYTGAAADFAFCLVAGMIGPIGKVPLTALPLDGA